MSSSRIWGPDTWRARIWGNKVSSCKLGTLFVCSPYPVVAVKNSNDRARRFNGRLLKTRRSAHSLTRRVPFDRRGLSENMHRITLRRHSGAREVRRREIRIIIAATDGLLKNNDVHTIECDRRRWTSVALSKLNYTKRVGVISRA